MDPKVALVSMPWTLVSEPSLGLAILRAQLSSEGIAARVFHSNIQLLRYVTGPAYHQVANLWALNEFVFTSVLDQEVSQDQVDALMERCAVQYDPRGLLPFRTAAQLGRVLIRLRHETVPRFLADCAEEILAYEPTMVGFTCLFDQTLASAALASLIRASRPDVLIVFGGYALEGPPGVEMLRSFWDIDAVAVGDGEPVIGALARASVGREPLGEIPGVLTRDNGGGRPRAKFELEVSPVPDYSDWFRDIAALKARDKVEIRTTVLPIESSRGCWWGQKQHCVFCGIDDATLKYRQKRPATVLALLNTLRERHGTDLPFRFSDYILPHSYTQDLLPALARAEPRYELQCEVKANQNEDRMRAFENAGFTELQPGIESFDSNVLRLMQKGVSGIHNVYCIKLGYVHNVQINYNILYGLPGEQPEWYRRLVRLVPRLYHLTPPISRTEMIVTRFAPMHMDPARFGVQTTPRHHRCYDALFSKEFLDRTGFRLDNYAYYFQRYFEFPPEIHSLYMDLVRTVDRWKNQHAERDVVLSYERDGARLLIRDSRFGEPRESRLDALQARVYLATDGAPRSVTFLCEELDLTHDEVNRVLEDLDRDGLVWREDDQVLGLAVPDAIVQRHVKNAWSKEWIAVHC